jgi:hypothetical protein
LALQLALLPLSPLLFGRLPVSSPVHLLHVLLGPPSPVLNRCGSKTNSTDFVLDARAGANSISEPFFHTLASHGKTIPALPRWAIGWRPGAERIPRGCAAGLAYRVRSEIRGLVRKRTPSPLPCRAPPFRRGLPDARIEVDAPTACGLRPDPHRRR